jgi:tetratricopeptide (TPR) repeat protein
MNALELAKKDAEDGYLKTMVFYFGGHGYFINGVNYLAPRGINPKKIKNTGINLNDLLSIIKDIQKHAKVMVFLDACRSDAKSGHRGDNQTWDYDDHTGLGILYSTSEKQASWELEEKKHGIYTYYLNEGLRGEADLKPYGNEDTFVSFMEVCGYVSRKLRVWSRSNSYGLSQRPTIDADEVSFDGFLITKRGNTAEEYKEKALEYFNKSLKIKPEVYGERNPDTATSYNNIGEVYYRLGEYEKALEYYNKAKKILLNFVDENHPNIKIMNDNIEYVKNKMKEDKW